MAGALTTQAPARVAAAAASESLFRANLHQLLSNWTAVAAAAVVLAFGLVALSAPWLAPQDPYEADLFRRLQPPVWLEGGEWAYPLGCDALGRDFASITRSSNFNTIVGATEAEARDRLAVVIERLRPHVGDERAAHIEQDYLASPAFGTPEQVAERLAERAAHGLGYSIHYFPEAAYDLSGIELFEREVIPALT